MSPTQPNNRLQRTALRAAVRSARKLPPGAADDSNLLVLNALWSYLFFGLHRLDLAMFDILVLWGAILAVGFVFYDTNRVAGALMLPYLAWVSFAACLNFALWHLNRGAP